LKKIFNKLDKAFEHRIRLSIVSILMVENSLNFNDIKQQLNLTDGNLASHMKALEKIEYITIEKSFIGKKPNTKYKMSRLGKLAFKKHLAALEELLNKHK